MKRIAAVVMVMVMMLMAAGCSGSYACEQVSIEQLTPEAAEKFAALEGERGIMLYADPNQMTSKSVRMYAVLYGQMGQELALKKSFSTLKMEIGGEAQDGFSVWRVTYNPTYVKRAEFVRNGETARMDAYEELTFVVEQAFVTPAP